MHMVDAINVRIRKPTDRERELINALSVDERTRALVEFAERKLRLLLDADNERAANTERESQE